MQFSPGLEPTARGGELWIACEGQHGWTCPQLLFLFSVRAKESNTCAGM